MMTNIPVQLIIKLTHIPAISQKVLKSIKTFSRQRRIDKKKNIIVEEFS